ncbi:hypothetical protein CAL7102_07548 [Dulcicalothrix desertica PCC 7102]|nr:hypothetical protein CAL7102_07548 [Dulcicalothrix desertica PCC 7102]
MTQAKKNKTPLFYPLTHTEWIDKDFTGALLKVSSDPYSSKPRNCLLSCVAVNTHRNLA